ncbi:hypothetical protein [Hydrogenophaga atypica]|uniref:Lipoprotein n=1 Tax=Hydrogenophaga atypica TaxID=249409 RepID=A0ABW2QIX2_9BURK
MNTRHFSLAFAATAVLALTACGEQPQAMGGVKSDQAPYTGVGKSQYAHTGWTAGDKGSWEQQLKARAQYGQNEYTRTTAK